MIALHASMTPLLAQAGQIRWLNFGLYHVTMICILLMLTVGLALINGRTGLFSLGHAGFWAVGAYTAGWVLTVLSRYKLAPALGAGAGGGAYFMSALCFAAAAVAAVIAAAVCGLLVGVPCLRLRGDYLAIATLGFGEIIRILIINTESLGGAAGMAVPTVLCSGGDRKYVFAALAFAGACGCLLLVRNLLTSTHGRALMSIREDEIASQLLGVDVTRYKVISFATGAGLAGLAGAVYAAFMGFLSPLDFGVMRSVELLLMVVLGGMASLTGTVIGTVVLYMIPETLRFLTWKVPMVTYTSQGWTRADVELDKLWMVFYAVLLVLMMLMRPQGLLGGWEISRLWSRRTKKLRTSTSARTSKS